MLKRPRNKEKKKKEKNWENRLTVKDGQAKLVNALKRGQPQQPHEPSELRQLHRWKSQANH
ncbi:MAG: hypothetical protein BRC33_09115 [Cyanobacteria bacterium SW_9_44_58]|nr:MAG: hypothetical protein BRC33_09115 [Cyanobacteria bacterium SW_9_44_58]